MIEHILIDRLKTDEELVKYCNDNVFAVSAPDGVKCPYIVVKDNMIRHGDDIIMMFNISINIYDYDTDKRKVLSAIPKIKNLLNCETLEDSNNIYRNIRIRFNTSSSTDSNNQFGSDPNLTIVNMDFSARAIEDIIDTEDITRYLVDEMGRVIVTELEEIIIV